MALELGVNCGFVTEAPSADPTGSSQLQDTRANAFKDTSPAIAVKVVEIGVYINNATEEADIEVGIYTHDAGNDEPETKLAGSATFAKGTTLGWKKKTGLNITISSSTVYWIAAQCDDTATATNTDIATTAGRRSIMANQTSLPATWDDAGGLDNRKLAVYAVWEAAEAGAAGIMTTNRGFWGPTF